MHTFASIAIGILMAAILGILFAGLIIMAKGGDAARSNRFMRYRVLFQGGAILLVMLFMSLLRS